MKGSLAILILLVSHSIHAETVSSSDFFNGVNSLNTPKMCALESLKNGVTILSCDGVVIRAELGEDYDQKNLTQVGSLLINKGLKLKNCENVRGSSYLGAKEESDIGKICFFAT